MGLDAGSVQGYLREVLGEGVEVLAVRDMKGGGLLHPDALKGFGYGEPLLVEALVGGRARSFVLSTLREAGGFGHEHFADRAQALLWSHSAYRRLPRHVRSLDVGFVTRQGGLRSAGDAVEFFLLMEKAEGRPYRLDLERLRDSGELGPHDVERALALSNYLVDIHRQRSSEEHLYRRRLRDLVGHGEGIMGVLDSYPPDFPLFPRRAQRRVERAAVDWRYRLKDRGHRLVQVHGDFHPWNILFGVGAEFTLLDRSRGEWGEAADDIAALAVNYLFFSLQAQDRLAGPLAALFEAFYENYLWESRDAELAVVIPLFFLFRALVLASPLWYPRIADGVRRALVRFIEALSDLDEFDPHRVNEYLGV